MTTLGERLKSASKTVQFQDYRWGFNDLPLYDRDKMWWKIKNQFALKALRSAKVTGSGAEVVCLILVHNYG